MKKRYKIFSCKDMGCGWGESYYYLVDGNNNNLPIESVHESNKKDLKALNELCEEMNEKFKKK